MPATMRAATTAAAFALMSSCAALPAVRVTVTELGFDDAVETKTMTQTEDGQAPDDVDWLEDGPVGHGWEVLDGTSSAVHSDADTGEDYETEKLDNGVHRVYGEGYSTKVNFGGYSSTALCSKYTRDAPFNGHTECPLTQDWYTLWPPGKEQFGKHTPCFLDEIRAHQSGNTLNSPPGTTTRLNKCPGHDDDVWRGGYDWRYGGIRPQDNPDMALYPEVKKLIEEKNAKDGKKAVIESNSGGTINAYAFLMTQTEQWRKDNILAFIARDPVFGGTISSIHSVLAGWSKAAMDKCSGRKAAIFIPSVLWMWPRAGEDQWSWNKTEVVVWTKSKNYTAYDLPEMLDDMGLPEVRKLLELEQKDFLDTFAPPMVDTYAFYGFGVKTQGGFVLDHRDFDPSTDGPHVCPDGKDKAITRPWDDGDGVGTYRSTARAGAWEDAHTKAGVVLKNYGYKGMGHTCNNQCKKDLQCVNDKLAGKPHGDC